MHKNSHRASCLVIASLIIIGVIPPSYAVPAPVSDYTPEKLHFTTVGRKHYDAPNEQEQSNEAANITRASAALKRNPVLKKILTEAEIALSANDLIRAEKIFAEANKLFPREIAPTLGQARINFIKGNVEKSVEIIKQLLKKNPLSSEAYSMLGDIYLGQDKFTEAKQALKNAISLEQGDSEALLRLAQIELRDKNFDTTEQYLRRALAADPHSIKARVLLARLLWYQNKLSESVLEYNSALAQDPENSVLLSELATIYSLTGKTIDCMGKLNDAYRYDPESIEIEKQYITVYGGRHDWGNALDAAKAWVQLEKNSAEAHGALAWSLLLNQEFDDAAIEAGIASKLLPSSPEIRNLQGIIKIEMRQVDDAIAQFKKAIELEKTYLPSNLNLVSALLVKKQFQDALDHLNRLEYIFPDDPNVLALHAYAALKSDKFEEAKKLSDHALKLSNDLPLALITQATLTRNANDLPQAEKLFLEIKARWSNSPLVLIELCKTFLLEDKGAEAIDMAQQALQLAPSNLDAKAALALALIHQKNFDGPISLLKECIARNPKDLSLRIELAKAQIATGEADFAEMTLDKAKTVFPDSAEPLLGLAEVSLRLNNVRQAREYLEEALTKDPHNHKAIVELASLKLDAGKAADCLAQLTGLSDDELGNSGLLLKARAELATQEIQLARTDFNKVKNQNALSTFDRIQLGNILWRLGEIEEAKQCISIIDIGEIDKNPRAKRELTKLQNELKQDKVKNKKR